ncbi:hypothetical protein [Bordetella pertussis]|nr:hypothetical protein [Bordetella pertussis]
MHGSSEPDLRNWRRAVPISRLNLDEYNLLTVHSYMVRADLAG